MDMQAFAQIALSALGVGAIVSGAINRRLSKVEKAAEDKREAQTKEVVLLLQGVKAAGALSYATAVAMKRGHANGEVEKGVEQYEEYTAELDRFLIERSAKQ